MASINRNLTKLRMPEKLRDAKMVRLLVWEPDPERPDFRYIFDIAEGTPEWIIKFFNKSRQHWIDCGCLDEATFERVPE